MPREFRRDPSPTHRTSYHFNPSAPSEDRRLSRTLGSLLVTGLLAGAAVGMIEPAQARTPFLGRVPTADSSEANQVFSPASSGALRATSGAVKTA